MSVTVRCPKCNSNAHACLVRHPFMNQKAEMEVRCTTCGIRKYGADADRLVAEAEARNATRAASDVSLRVAAEQESRARREAAERVLRERKEAADALRAEQDRAEAKRIRAEETARTKKRERDTKYREAKRVALLAEAEGVYVTPMYPITHLNIEMVLESEPEAVLEVLEVVEPEVVLEVVEPEAVLEVVEPEAVLESEPEPVVEVAVVEYPKCAWPRCKKLAMGPSKYCCRTCSNLNAHQRETIAKAARKAAARQAVAEAAEAAAAEAAEAKRVEEEKKEAERKLRLETQRERERAAAAVLNEKRKVVEAIIARRNAEKEANKDRAAVARRRWAAMASTRTRLLVGATPELVASLCSSPWCCNPRRVTSVYCSSKCKDDVSRAKHHPQQVTE